MFFEQSRKRGLENEVWVGVTDTIMEFQYINKNIPRTHSLNNTLNSTLRYIDDLIHIIDKTEYLC